MPACISEMVGQPGFDDGRVGGEQISKLIRNPGESPTHCAGRKFIQMHRDDSPGALHHELHGKPTDDKKREARWKNPERNNDYAEYRS